MILTGLARIGVDVELRYLPSGDPVANLALAYNYGKRDEGTGNRPTQWVDAVLWGPRAQALAPHLLKGTTLDVVVEDVHIVPYTKRDGSTDVKLAGRVASIEFAGPRRDADNQRQQHQQQQQQHQQQALRPRRN